MISRLAQVVILNATVCWMAFASVCFADDSVRIDHFELPVQNYAVIDLSASTTQQPIYYMGLDDANNAKFAYTETVGKGSAAETDFVVKNWSGGKITEVQRIARDQTTSDNIPITYYHTAFK